MVWYIYALQVCGEYARSLQNMSLFAIESVSDFNSYYYYYQALQLPLISMQPKKPQCTTP